MSTDDARQPDLNEHQRDAIARMDKANAARAEKKEKEQSDAAADWLTSAPAQEGAVQRLDERAKQVEASSASPKTLDDYAWDLSKPGAKESARRQQKTQGEDQPDPVMFSGFQQIDDAHSQGMRGGQSSGQSSGGNSDQIAQALKDILDELKTQTQLLQDLGGGATFGI